MNKTIRILIIFCGIIISIIPATYFIFNFIHIGLPNNEGTTAFFLMDVALTNGQQLPTWFMLLWGLIGFLIVLYGINKSKSKYNANE